MHELYFLNSKSKYIFSLYLKEKKNKTKTSLINGLNFFSYFECNLIIYKHIYPVTIGNEKKLNYLPFKPFHFFL